MVLLVVFGILLAVGEAGEQSHPFMIVRESEYPALRARAETPPWSIMRRQARETVATVRYRSSATLYQKSMTAHELGSACALTFILDTTARASVVEVVERDLRMLMYDIRTAKQLAPPPGEHFENVTTAHAAFMTYLVLDILYNHLTPSVRTAMEDDCDFIAANHRASWLESKYAIEGMMALYHHGPGETFVRKKDEFLRYRRGVLTEDGVYAAGPGYAHSRLYMEGRAQKKIFMDICEYQGFHEFYSEPRLRLFFEWFFGYAFTPFNRTPAFGDTTPTKLLDEFSSSLVRTGRFSPRALRYAIWHLGQPEEDDWRGGLLQYLLCDSARFTAEAPVSRIFPNGGGVLLERPATREALAGYLWNMATTIESHSHFDANAISLAGFGEHILRNSGYDGWQEPDSATWTWIHRTAESSNTLTIGDENHIDFRGGGVTAAIVGTRVEFVTGTSGPSLARGTHDRTLLFVHPAGDAPGYFVVLDDVSRLRPGEPIRVHWHPSSDENPRVISPGLEYEWAVKNCTTSGELSLRMVYVHAPAAVDLREGYLASTESCHRFVGKYHRSTYAADASGAARAAVVFMPVRDGDDAPPAVRVTGDGWTGLVLHLPGGRSDKLWSGHGDRDHAVEGIALRGMFASWREEEGIVRRYLIMKGRRFLAGSGQPVGFESEMDVSILQEGNAGTIVSPGGFVTFHAAGIVGIRMNGMALAAAKKGIGSVTVEVPAGTHTFELARQRSTTR